MVVPCSRRLARLSGQLTVLLADLLFIPGCNLCGSRRLRRRAQVCLACWGAVRRAPVALTRCLQCPAGAWRCRHRQPPWTACTVALSYEGATRGILRLYKFGHEGGMLPLAAPLGRLLSSALQASALHLDVDLVTAVPSHHRRRRQRGFDAAGRLATHACRAAGLPRPRALLRRLGRQGPRATTGTDPQRRDYVLRRRAAAGVAGRAVLLVDDICTTGATLERCAGLLRDAGAREVRVAVLARTPRRRLASGLPIE